jgi:hypothetical protein
MILFRRFEYITKREPEKVSRATNVYRNVFMDPESTLTIQYIYSEFNEWYKSSYSTLYAIKNRT